MIPFVCYFVSSSFLILNMSLPIISNWSLFGILSHSCVVFQNCGKVCESSVRSARELELPDHLTIAFLSGLTTWPWSTLNRKRPLIPCWGSCAASRYNRSTSADAPNLPAEWKIRLNLGITVFTIERLNALVRTWQFALHSSPAPRKVGWRLVSVYLRCPLYSHKFVVWPIVEMHVSWRDTARRDFWHLQIL